MPFGSSTTILSIKLHFLISPTSTTTWSSPEVSRLLPKHVPQLHHLQHLHVPVPPTPAPTIPTHTVRHQRIPPPPPPKGTVLPAAPLPPAVTVSPKQPEVVPIPYQNYQYHHHFHLVHQQLHIQQNYWHSTKLYFPENHFLSTS